MKRGFEIDPDASLDATVRFYFSEVERNEQTLSEIRAFRYDGAWVEESGPYSYGSTGNAHYVEVQNIVNVESGTHFALSAGESDDGYAIYLPLLIKRWFPRLEP